MFLAGTKEWNTWYGGGQSKWAAGLAVVTGNGNRDLVLNNSAAPTSYIPQMMRHELTHASTLQGKSSSSSWWLIEGIADVAGHPGGLRVQDWSQETKRYIRGKWNKTLPDDEPPANATSADVGAQYGVAFLAVQRLEKRFGRAKLLDFFDKVVRDRWRLNDASPQSFGEEWASVEADLKKAIQSYAA